MTASRWDGAGFTALTTKKRWDGASWVDLTVGKRWDGAAWQDIPGMFTPALGLSVAPSLSDGVVFNNEPAPSTAVVFGDSVTATRVNGTGPFTFLWTKVSGASAITPTNATSNITNFYVTVGKNQIKTGVWKCTVTDSLLATASALVNIELEYVTDI